MLLLTAALAAGCRTAPEPSTAGPAAPRIVPRRLAESAPWVPSPHFRPGPRTPADVDTIVIHTTEGAYDPARSFAENQARVFEGTVRYFQQNDREVSAHFVVGPGGEVVRMVDVRDIAHTQTYYNQRSIGIECAGWADRPETWTPELLDALVRLVAELAIDWTVPLVHPEGDAHGGPFAVPTRDGDRFEASGLVAHSQIQPWNKSDPGPWFPWDAFVERVRKAARGG